MAFSVAGESFVVECVTDNALYKLNSNDGDDDLKPRDIKAS